MNKTFLILFFLVAESVFSMREMPQLPGDSLMKMDFGSLEKKFNESVSTSEKALYTAAYYKKSKLQSNIRIVANGLYMKAYVSKDETAALKSIDSIKDLYGNVYDDAFPAKAHLLESNIYMASFSLKKALDAALSAEKLANKTQNIQQQYKIKQQIALIKIELGKYKEALAILRENDVFFKSAGSKSDIFFASMLLADVCIRLNMPEKAQEYVVVSLSKLKKSDRFYNYFIMYDGFCQSLKKNFSTSNLLLKAAIESDVNNLDPVNLAECYYFLGENSLQAKNDFLADRYFQKTDSILKATGVTSLAFRKNYIRAIEIQKRSKSNGKLLYYLNRLIEMDAQLNENNVWLSETINNQYDTPHLLAEKQNTINTIKQEKSMVVGIVAIVLLALSASIYYLLRMRKEKAVFEAKFNKLMLASGSKAKDTVENPIPQAKQIASKNIGLSDEIVNDILQKLTVFETEKQFLEINLKAADLARQFHTNTTYLSNVVNQYKNKNFSQYVNELRVEYAVHKLKEDKNFRKYTVKAISEEAGFNNAESFAKAFQVKTGIQPSFFVKRLNETL